MDLNLKGRVAAITGGSEGIGRAAAEVLAGEGAKVAICARRLDVLKQTAEEILKQTGEEVLYVQADVTRPDDIKMFVDEVLKRFGRIDILVNNAGRGAAESFEDVSEELWQEDLNLKLLSAIRCSREVLPYMKKQKYGRIINITTIGGKQPGARSLPTTVSRAAGLALTKALSKDYARDNILVNTVCIGFVKSMQWVRRWKREGKGMSLEEYYREMGKIVPLGRVGEAEEVGNVIAFLASDKASYVTGTSINLDGGASDVL